MVNKQKKTNKQQISKQEAKYITFLPDSLLYLAEIKVLTINMLIQPLLSNFFLTQINHPHSWLVNPHKHTYIATVSLDSAPQTDKQGKDGETSQITLNSVVLSLHIHIFSLNSLWLDLERMKSQHLSYSILLTC